MSIISLLFSSARKPTVADAIVRPDTFLQKDLVFSGGTLFVQGGLQIDAHLKGVTVEALDRKPIVLTALGRMEQCTIKGEDVLICGDFSGEVQARGDVEVTETGRITGVLRTAGVALVNPMAHDDGGVVVNRLAAEKVTDVQVIDERTFDAHGDSSAVASA